jgi:CHAT domain-containing protein
LKRVDAIDPVALTSVALPLADEEVAMIRGLAAAGANVACVPALRREFQRLVERGGFGVLHLVGHGLFAGSADASAVVLEDGPLRAADLSPATAAGLRRSAPLVFFNACHTGRTGYGLTRVGSWGARFVQLGCGGFVGAMWPVTDVAALAFARAFYRELSRGEPVGPAVCTARDEVRRAYPGDPTWLAYRAFADPQARVSAGDGQVTVSPTG